jgi:signal transduction histidine kinase
MGSLGMPLGASRLPGLLLIGLVIAGLVVAVYRGVTSPEAKTRRGRLRETGWNLALVAVSLLMLSASGRYLGKPWVLVVLPAAALGFLLARPRWTRRLVAAGLIALGLYGFLVTAWGSFGWLSWGPDQSGQYYGVVPLGQAGKPFYLLLPQSYLFLGLGGWLGWRSLDRRSAQTRWLLGRIDARRPWALLLLPVVVIAAALVIPNLWLGSGPAGILWTVLVLAVAIQAVRTRPERAASAAVAGLFWLGLSGLYLAGTYSNAGWRLPLNHAGYIEFGLVDVTSQVMADVAVAQALAFLVAGAWLTPRAAPGLVRYVGWVTNGELVQRVQRLTETRAVAVDTAAADLRRLERDLHDGAQARLVALGMNLRAVEKLIPVSPDAALALVAEARETSARALTELRELVRGVHPPVLADRGLGDAIKALALDSPLQIELQIDLPGRLPAPIETACYFAVAELLTNAAKHSGARTARLSAEHGAGVLRICLTDHGMGGADPGAGTGLAGVERRLATFDGIVAVSSPAGGPTLVVLEVPCVLSQPALRP